MKKIICLVTLTLVTLSVLAGLKVKTIDTQKGEITEISLIPDKDIILGRVPQTENWNCVHIDMRSGCTNVYTFAKEKSTIAENPGIWTFNNEDGTFFGIAGYKIYLQFDASRHYWVLSIAPELDEKTRLSQTYGKRDTQTLTMQVWQYKAIFTRSLPDPFVKDSVLNKKDFLLASSENGIYKRVVTHAPDNTAFFETTQSAQFQNVAYGNGKFVAAKTTGGIYVSENGTDWISSATLNSGIQRGLCYGNGLFISGADPYVITEEDGLKYSSDGEVWQKSNIEDGGYAAIAYGDGIFWAGRSGVYFSHDVDGFYSSSNGIDWTRATIRIAEEEWGYNLTGLRDISFGNKIFVAVGKQNMGIYAITNGSDWVKVMSGSFGSVTWWGGKFYVSQEDTSSIPGSLLVSENGTIWTTQSLEAEMQGGGTVFASREALFYANGTQCWYSLDGVSWTDITSVSMNFASKIAEGETVSVICAANGLFVSDNKRVEVDIPIATENFVLENKISEDRIGIIATKIVQEGTKDLVSTPQLCSALQTATNEMKSTLNNEMLTITNNILNAFHEELGYKADLHKYEIMTNNISQTPTWTKDDVWALLYNPPSDVRVLYPQSTTSQYVKVWKTIKGEPFTLEYRDYPAPSSGHYVLIMPNGEEFFYPDATEDDISLTINSIVLQRLGPVITTKEISTSVEYIRTWNRSPSTYNGNTNEVKLIDNAYTHVDPTTNTVLKLQFPEGSGGVKACRLFYLVLTCSEETAGTPSIIFDTSTSSTLLIQDGDASIFNTQLGTNIYKFEEIGPNIFFVSRIVGKEL